MMNRIAKYDWSEKPDRDELKIPNSLHAIFQVCQKVQNQTDQSRAPIIDEKAKILIRKCVWDLLPEESAEYIEGLGIRFQDWNLALLKALIERRQIEKVGGSVPEELL